MQGQFIQQAKSVNKITHAIRRNDAIRYVVKTNYYNMTFATTYIDTTEHMKQLHEHTEYAIMIVRVMDELARRLDNYRQQSNNLLENIKLETENILDDTKFLMPKNKRIEQYVNFMDEFCRKVVAIIKENPFNNLESFADEAALGITNICLLEDHVNLNVNANMIFKVIFGEMQKQAQRLFELGTRINVIYGFLYTNDVESVQTIHTTSLEHVVVYDIVGMYHLFYQHSSQYLQATTLMGKVLGKRRAEAQLLPTTTV